MALACRLCRTPVTSIGGCEPCVEFKKNLVDTEEDPETVPSLTDVSQESILVLRQLVRKSKEYLDKGDAKSFGAGAKLALQATSAVAKVLDTARKLQTDGVAVIKTMGFMERLELFADWYLSLPPPYRAKLLGHLTQLERAPVKSALPEAEEEEAE